MEKNDRRCSICGGVMVEGFILDFYKENQTATRWVEGKPEKTFIGAVAFSDRQNYHITAFRCDRCSYLEFFAIEPQVLKDRE
jgi:hypothetical protein